MPGHRTPTLLHLRRHPRQLNKATNHAVLATEVQLAQLANLAATVVMALMACQASLETVDLRPHQHQS